MTPKEWAEQVCDIIKERIAKETGRLRDQIEHLEQRLAAVEKDPASNLKAELSTVVDRLTEMEGREQRSLADSFEGPWLPQKLYRRGALTQHGGNVWLALTDTEGRPGQDQGWRLLLRGAK